MRSNDTVCSRISLSNGRSRLHRLHRIDWGWSDRPIRLDINWSWLSRLRSVGHLSPTRTLVCNLLLLLSSAIVRLPLISGAFPDSYSLNIVR